MSAALVSLEGVGKRYEGGDRGAGTAVLSDVDLELAAGESLAIVGPSGCGKSTLLNLVGGLLPPTEGRVCFDGRNLAELDPEQLAALRNQQIGFIFQFHHLLPQCSALENVLVPTLVDGDRARRPETRDRAQGLLDAVGLGDRMQHRPAQLSGGECQRVAVVRALINEPRLLLADEPTGSLDAKGAERLGELLRELNQRESVALMTVTHSQRLAARMQRVLALEEGRLQAAEASAES